MAKMTPKEFWLAAAQWGSFTTNGDPGACMYGFDEKGLVQSEKHRAECLAWIDRCRKEDTGLDAEEASERRQELDDLAEYIKSAPIEGETPDLDAFTAAYVAAALWSSNDYSDENGGDPFDANYGPEHIAPKTLQRMKDDCDKFREIYGAMLTDEAVNDARRTRREYSADDIAGHDFWLTRVGHGTGFWDGDFWKKEAGEILTRAAKSFGEFELYVGDDGRIHGSGGNPSPEPVDGAPAPPASMSGL